MTDIPGQPIIEPGFNNDVTILEDRVDKITKWQIDYDRAAQVVGNLYTYAAQLGKEPLSTVELGAVDIVPVENKGLCRVRHTVSRVPGTSVARLSEDERRVATSVLLGQVAGMSTTGDRDTLLVPVDAMAENCHVDASGNPVLIDLFPPLNRPASGEFPFANIMHPTTVLSRRFLSWSMGTKSGVMTRILSSAVDRGPSVAQQVKYIIRSADDWCYDMVPSTLDSKVRSRIRRQIAARFVPYLTFATAQIKLQRSWH